MNKKTNNNNQELQVQFVPVDRLIPSPDTIRTHREEQVAQIAASMREFGWTDPILVRPDGRIIAGHARLRTARQLGLSKVPIMQLSAPTDAQCRALAIADNQLALNAGWDEDLLRAELESLNQEHFDLKLLGFSDEDRGSDGYATT